jgi:Fe-S-cluster containining protein
MAGHENEALEALRELHREVDESAARVATRHGARLHCERGCSSCCVDGQEVFRVEAERIRLQHAELLREGWPQPPGTCAFLDEEGACRVYESRPYRCRTQGLPLRWFDEGPGGEPVELRDVCELNEEGGPPVEELEEADCWTLGPFEARLAELEERFSAGRPGRVALRELFLRNGPA